MNLLLYQLLIFLNIFLVRGQLVITFYFTRPVDRKRTTFKVGLNLSVFGGKLFHKFAICKLKKFCLMLFLIILF